MRQRKLPTLQELVGQIKFGKSTYEGGESSPRLLHYKFRPFLENLRCWDIFLKELFH